MVIGVFVMLNMFIAIISDAYIDTKAELESKADMESDLIGTFAKQ